MSLPLIYDKQILNHKMNSYYTKEKKKIINKIKIEKKKKNSKEKKYIKITNKTKKIKNLQEVKKQ